MTASFFATRPGVGLTGGIACGKSTVAKVFSKLGAFIIDADQISREVVLPGTPGLTAIVKTFGESILKNGELDRAKLGSIVFQSAELREKLEDLLHPLIFEESRRQILAVPQNQLVVYEAALLLNDQKPNQIADFRNSFTPVVAVICDPETQIKRLCARNQLTRDQALARIHSQMSLKEVAQRADFTIQNDGSAEELEKSARKLLQTMGF